MQAAKRAHNFVVDFSLLTTSTVVEVLRCRSPFRSLPSRLIYRTLTQMRCRTVAVHRRWYRTLWAPTTLAVESPTDLFVASHWLERSPCRFTVTLLVFSRADHSTSQVLTTLCGFYLNFYWRFASKASKLIRPPADWFTAATSHAAVDNDARSIQIKAHMFQLSYNWLQITDYLRFYPRDVVSGVFATATWLAGCLSVCLSVCHSRYCIKTTKSVLKYFGPSGSLII